METLKFYLKLIIQQISPNSIINSIVKLYSEIISVQYKLQARLSNELVFFWHCKKV